MPYSGPVRFENAPGLVGTYSLSDSKSLRE